MRLSQYFFPILKENPKEAEIVSHRLMLRAAMIKQHSSGIYSWLPLGKRVLDKISNIVRKEQEKAGFNELLMPIIQPADIWHESGRYNDYGAEMLRFKDRNEREILYGPTNEEMITDIFRSYVKSYKSLPVQLYQIQWKFRDELRPRFGVMRGREFLMKDAYSFDINEEEAVKSYNRMFVAYLQSFANMGLSAIPMRADTGPIGGNLSHEFIIFAKTGETSVYCDKKYLNFNNNLDICYEDSEALAKIVQEWTTPYAATEEIHDNEMWHKLSPEDQIEARGIEVGHIFYFGVKYSAAMQVKLAGSDGKDFYPHMGSYGIGISRLVAAAIEASHDEHGIIWQKQLAPFDFAIINMHIDDALCSSEAEKFYNYFTREGYAPLLDDRAERAGVKFASQDLIGLPYQVIFGAKDVADNVVEIKERRTLQKIRLSIEEAYNFISEKMKEI